MSDTKLEVGGEEEFTEHELQFDEIDDFENQLSNISIAQQNYIQSNYKKLPIESLAQATQLPEVIVSAYIERYEQYLLSRGINPDGKFALTINVDETGSVGYSIQWPKAHEIDTAAEMFGKLLFLITTKKLNESIVRFLLKVGSEHNADALIHKVLEVWKKNEDAKKQPLIKAHEVMDK